MAADVDAGPESDSASWDTGRMPTRARAPTPTAEPPAGVGEGRDALLTTAEDDVIYKAAAALPHDNRESAVDALRGQLRIMAVAGGVTPDWTTLDVVGPTEMAGAEDRTRFEWRASVAVPGATLLDAPPDPHTLSPAGTAEDATVSFRIDDLAA